MSLSLSSAPCLYNSGQHWDGQRCYRTTTRGSGYCELHQPPAFTYTRRMPPGWVKKRETVIRRDKGICYLCGKAGADGADHVTPVSQGGTDDLHNLKAVHHAVAPYCHRKKTAQEAAHMRKQMKPRRRNQF